MPARWRVLLVLVLYAGYLPLSGYTPYQFRFDAAEYWELSLKFTPYGHFSLLAYDAPIRGYLGPLLILPARFLCHYTSCSMLTGGRILGAGWAALLFGLAIPALWAQLSPRPLTAVRWLLLVGLTFIFWRDYFNFTLSDMPAMTVLVLGLVAVGRPGRAWAGLAGLLLAAAINIRPIYLVSAPGWLWLLLGAPLPAREQWRRVASLIVGLLIILLPQFLINVRHFRQPTPLVLTSPPGHPSLYLRQLAWGTAFQRYETSLIPEIPRSLVYADSGGQRALASIPRQRFASFGQFLGLVGRQPLVATGRYLRHLFNGLDLWFPTPYPRRLHPPGQVGLRLLNYALLGLGVWLAGAALGRARRAKWRPAFRYQTPTAAVLLALLLPCLLVVPTLIECRFLLPLHLVLLTGVAGGWRPGAGWRELGSPVRRIGLLALALGWLWGCWQLSAATARQLRPSSEAPAGQS